MEFCEKCGSALDKSSSFCASCGAPVLKEKSKQQPMTAATPSATLEPLVARNFWYWFLLTMALSIINLIYLYFNFEDLNKLYKYPRSSEVTSSEINLNNIIILIAISILCGLGVFIMPYIFYLKFKRLHDYIEKYPKKLTNKPLSGEKYLRSFFLMIGILIFGLICIALSYTVLFGLPEFVFIIAIVLGYLAIFCSSIGWSIYFIIQSYKWQEAYNELAYLVCPQTIKKDLF